MSILRRDIAHMNIEVERGKLSGMASRDLVNYLKFLTAELEARRDRSKDEANAMAKLTPEQLKEQAKALIEESDE